MKSVIIEFLTQLQLLIFVKFLYIKKNINIFTFKISALFKFNFIVLFRQLLKIFLL